MISPQLQQATPAQLRQGKTLQLRFGDGPSLDRRPGAAVIEVADGGDLPQAYLLGVPGNAYDTVLAPGLLQHLERPDEALANWLRVLRPGGVLQITVPEKEPEIEARWRFVVQDPESGVGRTVNLLELVQVVCHMAELDSLSSRDGRNGSGEREIAITLRKRPATLTPVQSNNSPEVKTLVKLTQTALIERGRWQPMDEFEEILASGVLEKTVVDLSRLYLLYQWLLMTLEVPGDCMEVGSYRGGTAKLFSELLLRRGVDADLHLFDTFEGMPEQLSIDEVGLQGAFADTSLEAVQRLLANNPRVRFHQGIFPASLPADMRETARFRFAHIDVDIESSVLDCLHYIYPRLSAGGIIVVDDYGHPQCPGATRAVEHFFRDRPETVVQMPLLSSAVIVKQAPL